ncbi:hypothetical protein [Limihaloglobus sulfuriphilus]|nr:hypothetical protein [Limihaloglobus sulfuriphilus]
MKSEISVPQIEQENEIDIVVWAGIYEIVPFQDAPTIYSTLQSHFVDWNDLRVSRHEEIKDVLGSRCLESKLLGENIKSALNAIFDKYDCLSLEMLLEKGKREASRELDTLTGMSKYIIDFFMLTAMGAQHLPMSKRMFDYVKFAGLVYPGSKESEIKGFLERQIPVSELYSLYCYIKAAADQADIEDIEAHAEESNKAKTAKKKTPSKSKKSSAKAGSAAKKTVKSAAETKTAKKKTAKKTATKKSAAKKTATKKTTAKKTAPKAKSAKKKTAAKKK